jgi:hypothetical protein
MDFLKDILGEELFSSVSGKINAFNKANPDKPVKLADLSSGGYVDKNKYADMETLANGYKSQIAQRDKDIAELKKQTSNGELQGALNALQKKYDDDTASLTEQLKQTKFNSALDLALEKSGAKSTKALRGLLDMEKITLENNALSGFSEQLEQIKAENDFLFEAEKQKAGGMRQGGSPAGEEDVFLSSARAAAGLKNEKGD